MNKRKSTISLFFSHKTSIKISIIPNISRISMHYRINTHHSNHTLKEGGLEASEVEKEKEDLVEEEVQLYAITVDIQAIM